ncbi:Urb2/Npa2 family-domain-containing protein [Dipodascopsis uninucleata]
MDMSIERSMSLEQVTRHLRGKTKDLNSIVIYASHLLDINDDTLEFPGKNEFLMEWWFDRISLDIENINFWGLFIRTACQLDHETFLQIYQRHKFPEIVRLGLERFSKSKSVILSDLRVVFDVIEYVQCQNVWLRCSFETLTSILNSFLELTLKTVNHNDNWTDIIFKVYDNTLYGVSNFKRLSATFSDDNIVTIMKVLGFLEVESHLFTRLSDVLRDILFSPSITIEMSKSKFKRVFSIVAKIPDVHSNAKLIQRILHLALSKFAKTRQRTQMVAISQAFIEFSPANSYCILQECTKYDVKLSLDIFKVAVTGQVGDIWNFRLLILKNEPDAILLNVENVIFKELMYTSVDSDVSCFVERLVSTYSDIRNIQEFLTLWSSTLRDSSISENSILMSERLIQFISLKIAESWTSHQISGFLLKFNDGDDSMSLRALISVLTAISLRPEVLSRNLVSILINLFKVIQNRADDYLVFRSMYLIVSFNRDIALAVLNSNDDMLSKKLLDGSDYKILYFTIQIALRLSEFEVFEWFSVIVDHILNCFDTAEFMNWKNSYEDINAITYPTALICSLLDRWLVVIEHRFNEFQMKIIASSMWKFALSSDSNFSRWESLLSSHQELFEQVILKDYLIDEIITCLQVEDRSQILLNISKSKRATMNTRNVSKAIHSLMHFPLASYKRFSRECILDLLLYIDYSSNSNLSLDCRHLMEYILDAPNMSSILQKNIMALESLVDNMTCNDDMERVTVNIVDKVFRHAQESGAREDGVKFLYSVNTRVMDHIKDLNTAKIGRYILFTRSSLILRSEIDVMDEIQLRLKAAVTHISNEILDSKDDLDLTQFLLQLLADMYTASEIKTVLEPNILKILPLSLRKLLNKRELTAESYRLGHIVQTIFCIYLDSLNVIGIDLVAAENITATYHALLKISNIHNGLIESGIVKTKYKIYASNMSSDIYTEVFEQLFLMSFPLVSADSIIPLQILTTLIAVPRHDCQEFILKKLMCIVCSLVLDFDKIESSEAFVKVLQLITSVLRDRPSLITAFVLEQILLFLVKSTSKMGPKFSDTYDVDDIYKVLCGTVSTILISYHRLLRGRHNLIISILQNLLYFLCVPRAAISMKRPDMPSATYWKRASWLATDRVCSMSSGVAYSRLLSNLCESNLSRSTVSKRKRNEIDEKGADIVSLSTASGASRRALSKHIPFLIVEICHAALNFKFDIETRKTLNSGFYSLLDFLSQNELKVVNAALDNSSRVIFRTLYQDYNNYGKWHGE